MGLVWDWRRMDRRGLSNWERTHEGLGMMKELQEVGDPEASGEEVGNR